jgi:hypothetical protein
VLLIHLGVFLIAATLLVLLDLYRHPGSFTISPLLKAWTIIVALHASIAAAVPLSRWLTRIATEETESVRNAPAIPTAGRLQPQPGPPREEQLHPLQDAASDLITRAATLWRQGAQRLSAYGSSERLHSVRERIAGAWHARLPLPSLPTPSKAAGHNPATIAADTPAPPGPNSPDARRLDLWQDAAGRKPSADEPSQPDEASQALAERSLPVDPLVAATSPDTPLPGTDHWSWVEAAAEAWLTAREPQETPAEASPVETTPDPSREAVSG